MGSFIDTMFEFLDQETENCDDLEVKIFKLISDQETANNDETDIKISKLIQTIGQEEEEQKETGKASISTCASTLMLFLNQVSGKLLSSTGRNLRFGCPDIEKCLSLTDLSNEVLNRDNVELNPPSTQANETPSTAELDTASSSHIGQVSALDQSSISKPAQLQGKNKSYMTLGPSHNVPQTHTEGAPLPLLHLHVVPTSKIVNRLSQLKQKTLKGPSKRLKCKIPKT